MEASEVWANAWHNACNAGSIGEADSAAIAIIEQALAAAHTAGIAEGREQAAVIAEGFTFVVSIGGSGGGGDATDGAASGGTVSIAGGSLSSPQTINTELSTLIATAIRAAKDADHVSAKDLASTLDGIVSAGFVSGLLPEQVSAAAQMLRDQSATIAELECALATSEHTVTVTISEAGSFRSEIKAHIVIADPRQYSCTLLADTYRFNDRGFLDYQARALARNLTGEWQREIEEKTTIALRRANKGPDHAE